MPPLQGRPQTIIAMNEKKKLTDYISNAEARELFERQTSLSEVSAEDRSRLQSLMHDAVLEMADGLRQESEEIYSSSIREKLGDIPEGLSMSFIAKVYFGKSKEWLYQRLNGSTVNGKKAFFKREEVLQLQNAIRDFGNKLSTITLL